MVSKDLEVDGLKVVLANQPLVRYELVPLGQMESLLQRQFLEGNK
jgi:hypothetical protein